MATYSNFYTVSVPAIGGTYSLPSDENWDLYLLTSNTGAAITVTGVIDVVPTGTIIEGLVYEIIYDGTLLGTNTFTIFGEVIPLGLRDKKLKITATRISSSWVINIDFLDYAGLNPYEGNELQLTYSTTAPVSTVGQTYQDLLSIPYEDWYPENVGDVSIIKAIFNWDSPPVAEGAVIYFYANGYPHPNSPTTNWANRFFSLPYDAFSTVLEFRIQKLSTDYAISFIQSTSTSAFIAHAEAKVEFGSVATFTPGTPTAGTPLVVETIITDGTPTAVMELASCTVVKGKIA